MRYAHTPGVHPSERSVDFLIREEIMCNPRMLDLLATKCRAFRGSTPIACHIGTKDDYGEVDILVELKCGNRDIFLMMENKIKADFGFMQDIRYKKRKEDIGLALVDYCFMTCLTAPQKYITQKPDKSQNFDFCLSYEEISKAIGNEDTRSAFRSKMLLDLCVEFKDARPSDSDAEPQFIKSASPLDSIEYLVDQTKLVLSDQSTPDFIPPDLLREIFEILFMNTSISMKKIEKSYDVWKSNILGNYIRKGPDKNYLNMLRLSNYNDCQIGCMTVKGSYLSMHSILNIWFKRQSRNSKYHFAHTNDKHYGIVEYRDGNNGYVHYYFDKMKAEFHDENEIHEINGVRYATPEKSICDLMQRYGKRSREGLVFDDYSIPHTSITPIDVDKKRLHSLSMRMGYGNAASAWYEGYLKKHEHALAINSAP